MNRFLLTSVFVSFLFLLTPPAFAQLISTDPSFPTDIQPVLITFDATQGSGGLAGYTGDVYAHTGVITNLSTSGSDWKYVVTNWGQNTPETKLTKIDDDLYTLNIGPSIRQYYGVPQSETILQMAFVFRSAQPVSGTSYLEGKTSSGGDIFVDIFGGGSLNVSFLVPDSYGNLLELNDQLSISVAADMNTDLKLYVNGNLHTQVSASSLQTTLTASVYGKYRVKAVASDGTNQVEDSIYYYVRPPVQTAALPADVEYGINYLDNETVILALHAPQKVYAFAPGSYSNWELDDSNYMKRTPNGSIYWVEIGDLTPGMEYTYQYWINGDLQIGDPYCEKILDPWRDHEIPEVSYPNLISYPVGKTEGIVSVLQTNSPAYNWNTTSFTPPAKEKMVVYELLVRDFTDERNYQTLIDTLAYLEYLGVNVIELMPVNEFENNNSWGYNPSYYFAVDKFYGSKNKLKEFIDACHERGMAVVLDIVLNHSFGQSPMVQMYWDAVNNRPAANNPWYNQEPKHDYNVGYDFNHESLHTRAFSKRVLEFWLEEFKIDGFRYDLSKGFTQVNTLGNVSAWGNYDASRITILKEYGDHVWAINPDAWNILEHFSDNDEETELADYGFMFWGNMNHNYNEATMGYPGSNLSWGVYDSRGWSEPNLITYMESHDEERLMFKNLEYGNSSGSYNVKDLSTALDRIELAACFFFPLPGPKMLWQFGEFGYDVSIDFNGRTGIKPTKWNYFFNQDRNQLFHIFRALIHLKVNEPAFSTLDYSAALTTYGKRINLNHSDMNVTIVGNFNVTSTNVNPNFQHTGWWYNYFTGDSVNISNTSENISLAPGEYLLYTDKKLAAPVLEYIPVSIEETAPVSFISNVFPNPSRNQFTIQFDLARDEWINVMIFDSKGQHINTLLNRRMQMGSQEIVWPGTNASGQMMPPGIYILRVSGAKEAFTQKLIKSN